MNSSQNGGKSKSSSSKSKSLSSKSKKGGNFLGSVSELFVPTGWESFATAAGLLAAERAAAAFRKGRNSSKKQKGGADTDGHETLENMEHLMETIGDNESFEMMSGGAKKKPTAKKSTAKKSTAKKSTAKKTAKKPAKKPAKKTTKK